MSHVYGQCEQCGNDVHGDIQIVEITDEEVLREHGADWGIAEVPTPDRDWIVCDGCNVLLCRNCAHYWQTGYCDDCLAAADDENAELHQEEDE